FGVVLVRSEGAEVQVATFRSDHSYGDGRRPEAVSFETDPRQDVLRRDFTINALLEDPFSGEIVDYVGGRADLDAGLIRAIGDPRQRFAEDHCGCSGRCDSRPGWASRSRPVRWPRCAR